MRRYAFTILLFRFIDCLIFLCMRVLSSVFTPPYFHIFCTDGCPMTLLPLVPHSIPTFIPIL